MMNNEQIVKNYWIASKNQHQFFHELDKLNRRAARLGVPQIQYRKTGQSKHEKRTSDITGEVVQVREYVEVELSGQAPKYAGWALAAVLEHTPEGNIIRKSPDCKVELSAYREVKPLCEHCKTIRNRRDTYLVIHDDGSIKQVGHDCLKDFLGHNDPHQLAQLAEIWFSAGELGDLGGDFEGFGGYGSKDDSIYARSLLAYAALAIRRFGYVSRKYAEEHPDQNVVTTRMRVISWMFPTPEELQKARNRGEEWPRPEEQDKQFAEKAVEYVLNTLENKLDLSDFESNILIASKLEIVEGRAAGIACYVPEYYRRSIERAKEREAKQLNSNNVHFGEVNKRYRDVELEYARTISWDSEFGIQFRHFFYTADRIQLSWKTGNDLGLFAGQKVKVTFTVKKHGDWKGWKQTDISRAKVS